jgi:hypothetical protein
VSIDDNKAVVQGVFEAINARALERLSEFVADDVVDHNAVKLITEGDKVDSRFTLSGNNLGEYRGLPQPPHQHFDASRVIGRTARQGSRGPSGRC